MTKEERDAIDGAVLHFRQIACLAGFIQQQVAEQPDLCDAIGGIESLSDLASRRLDRAFLSGIGSHE